VTEKKVNAMTYSPPPVVINGVKYRRQRLGVRDELRLVELLLNAGVKLGIAPDGLDNISAGEMAGHLFSLLSVALDDVLDFLRGTLIDFPLTVEEMKDPDKFPLGSMEAIIESIAQDKDVEAFFGHIRNLLNLRTKMKARSPGKSSSSKAKRGGQTKK